MNEVSYCIRWFILEVKGRGLLVRDLIEDIVGVLELFLLLVRVRWGWGSKGRFLGFD